MKANLSLLVASITGLLVGVTIVSADIVFENEMIIPEEIYDLKKATDSEVSIFSKNQSKYYCIFRSNWNKQNHPAEYPKLARWGAPVVFAHTKQYTPYLKNREAPFGVEKLAESGFIDDFIDEVKSAGSVVGDFGEGVFQIVNQSDWNNNYQYLPPVNVTLDYNYISAVAGITPSPDWFTGFYLFETTKDDGQIFFDRFKIRTYPWDAGTDNGQHYMDVDEDTDPAENIVRITKDNAPNGDIFVNPSGDDVIYVAEWECILHTCPLDEPGCQKEEWPPENGCDVLKYPECDKTCDPASGDPSCVQCSDGLYHLDCCLAGVNPQGGQCAEDADGGSANGADSANGGGGGGSGSGAAQMIPIVMKSTIIALSMVLFLS